jgi:hypothetical protein
VPSFDASTPDPAAAVFTPWGSKTGGRTLRHVAVQGVPLVFRMYTVSPAARIAPSLGFIALETTLAVAGLVAAEAALEANARGDSPPTVRTTIALRPNDAVRLQALALPVRFIS